MPMPTPTPTPTPTPMPPASADKRASFRAGFFAQRRTFRAGPTVTHRESIPEVANGIEGEFECLERYLTTTPTPTADPDPDPDANADAQRRYR
jgi:hypothetical protein